MNGGLRAKLASKASVKFANPQKSHIGEGVIFDSLYPENIEIGVHTTIAMQCILLTHSWDTNKVGYKWKQHHIKIGNCCFIGARSIICSDVVIEDNSIIGDGSIVTKNIPPNQIWAGNPCRFIKERKQ